jgi:hypothetical protein
MGIFFRSHDPMGFILLNASACRRDSALLAPLDLFAYAFLTFWTNTDWQSVHNFCFTPLLDKSLHPHFGHSVRMINPTVDSLIIPTVGSMLFFAWPCPNSCPATRSSCVASAARRWPAASSLSFSIILFIFPFKFLISSQ